MAAPSLRAGLAGPVAGLAVRAARTALLHVAAPGAIAARCAAGTWARTHAPGALRLSTYTTTTNVWVVLLVLVSVPLTVVSVQLVNVAFALGVSIVVMGFGGGSTIVALPALSRAAR